MELNFMMGKTIDQINIGDSACFQKTLTENDVYLYASISGDNNPAHINEEYARNNIFKERIVNGLLTASLISAVLGTQLPGPGTIYLSQECKFINSVKFNDTIKATVEVIEINNGKNNVKLSTICTNQHDEVVLIGTAIVRPPKKDLI